MVLQGGPEVPKWLPKVLPRCQNGSQNVRKDAPRPRPNGDPAKPKGAKKKGPAAEGVAFKIRRTPAGGAGRD